jgi:hypothetical protein
MGNTRRTPKRACYIRRFNKSIFFCAPCNRHVSIPWAKLNNETPKCCGCGNPLTLNVPSAMKGVLPFAIPTKKGQSYGRRK